MIIQKHCFHSWLIVGISLYYQTNKFAFLNHNDKEITHMTMNQKFTYPVSFGLITYTQVDHDLLDSKQCVNIKSQ